MSINFLHQTDTTNGTLYQTKAVNTVVRVGLVLPGTLLATPMHVTMSLHDGSGEITANRIKAGKQLYNKASSSIPPQELRDYPVQHEAESDGGADARRACVATATFDFKFSVTAADVSDSTTHTPVWLRFAVEGTPELYVCTPPFRLVARADEKREKPAGFVLSAQKLLREQVLSR